MATVRQLAKLAGVCPATVSRALRGDPRISQATRERVRQLADAFRRHPEQKFQALLNGQSGVIGCLLPTDYLPHSARILQGILEEAFASAYHVSVLHVRTDWQDALLAYHALAELPVDGIIMAHGMVNLMPPEMLLNFWSRGIKVVGIGSLVKGMPMDIVQNDEACIGELMVEYLWDLGHRAIGYCGHVGERSEYIKAALRRRRGALAAEYQVNNGDMHNALAALLAASTPPTAIIAYSDIIAAALLQQAWRRGVRVPQNLSILGCTNIPLLAQYTIPPLTTIEENPEEKGRRIVSLLLNRIHENAPEANRTPAKLLVAPHLVIRESCAPPQRGIQPAIPGAGKPAGPAKMEA